MLLDLEREELFMEITYAIEPDDFVAFNLSYIQGNPVMRANIRNTRMISSGIILIGGCILMQVLQVLNILTAAVYVALSIAVFFAVPVLMKRRVRKSILRMLARPQNKNICSDKTMTLAENELILTGGGEDSHYEYQVVERVTEDDGHYFIYVGAMAALIVPFRAFSNGEEKAAFYKELCTRIQNGGGKIAA